MHGRVGRLSEGEGAATGTHGMREEAGESAEQETGRKRNGVRH